MLRRFWNPGSAAKSTPYRNQGRSPLITSYRLGVAEGDGAIDPLCIGDATGGVPSAGASPAPEAGAGDKPGEGFAAC